MRDSRRLRKKTVRGTKPTKSLSQNIALILGTIFVLWFVFVIVFVFNHFGNNSESDNTRNDISQFSDIDMNQIDIPINEEQVVEIDDSLPTVYSDPNGIYDISLDVHKRSLFKPQELKHWKNDPKYSYSLLTLFCSFQTHKKKNLINFIVI